MPFHIQVNSEDFLQAIFQAKTSNPNAKILVMDMANGQTPGGGRYKNYNGSPKIMYMGQEEKLCANSDLLQHLTDLDYPINALAIQPICKSVTFFDKEDLKSLSQATTKVDVAICVAPKCSYGEEPNIAQLQAQIQMFLTSAKDYDIVLASAFGCGGFQNDPSIVSKLFKEEAKRSYCPNVVELQFLIYKENYVMDNYTIFHKTLHEQILGSKVETIGSNNEALGSLEEE